MFECITSASCTSIKAWEKIGGFDDWLFIDLVDNEFCKRLVASGYKILRLNHLVLDQEFGCIHPKGEFSQKFWITLSKDRKSTRLNSSHVSSSYAVHQEQHSFPNDALPISIKAWEKIGGFDDWLFIDLVDNEFCKRLVASGYKILRLNHLVLDQEFGCIHPKGEFSQKFWITLS